MQTDPIADFLTRIRNAAAAKHQRVDVRREAQSGNRPHSEGRRLHLDL
jgi:ribosomal protein S8